MRTAAEKGPGLEAILDIYVLNTVRAFSLKQ